MKNQSSLAMQLESAASQLLLAVAERHIEKEGTAQI